jgi:4-amino-4-deoxy-L-arabinose transferase-like glycosyltransferase
LCLCILYVLSGLALIPYLGVQTDEAIFTSALYEPFSPWFWISVFKRHVPLMIMSYLGTLKAGIYAIVFSIWRPSAMSLRVPMLVAGAGAILLLYLFTRKTVNRTAALFAVALLATETSTLLATCFDWGPVTLQRLLLMSGVVGCVTFHQTGRRWALAAGFFCFGLGLWDKALFAWMLTGLGVATVAIFHRVVLRHLTIRNLSYALIFFVLGALPLIIYNIRRPLETFQGNASFSSEGFFGKMTLLPAILDGRVFFGYFADEDWAVTQKPPRTASERATVWLSDLTHGPRRSLAWPAFAAALLLIPIAWKRRGRTILWTLVFLCVAWVQMLVTRNAGGGAHHTLLLWPFPLYLMAVVWEDVAQRAGRNAGRVLAVVAVLVCGSNLLVTNHYRAQMIRNGAPGTWSDGIYTLVERLRNYQGRHVFLTDWGMADNLRMLGEGKIALSIASGPLMNPEPTEANRQEAAAMLRMSDAIYVSFTDDKQVFAEVNPRLNRLAGDLGYRREDLETVCDSNGRPVFRIFRFVKQSK